MEKLATYPAPASNELMKEFYTNAIPRGGVSMGRHTSYVRGQVIRYDLDTINSFLGTEWPSEQCQFALNLREFREYEEIERVITVEKQLFSYDI